MVRPRFSPLSVGNSDGVFCSISQLFLPPLYAVVVGAFLPRQAFSINTSSRSIEPIVLPLHCFFNRTLSSLDITNSIETFLLTAVVTLTVFRSAGRVGVAYCSSELKDGVVKQYNRSEDSHIWGDNTNIESWQVASRHSELVPLLTALILLESQKQD